MAILERKIYVLTCDGCAGDGPTVDYEEALVAAKRLPLPAGTSMLERATMHATALAQKQAVENGWWLAPKGGSLKTAILLCRACQDAVAEAVEAHAEEERRRPLQ